MKYILCRPSGGFNDKICQIYLCIKMATKTGYTLLLDIEMCYDLYFNFSDVFDISVPDITIISDSKKIKEILISLDNPKVYPEALQNNLYNYEMFSHNNVSCLLRHDKMPPETYVEASIFIFDKLYSYDEKLKFDIILHHSFGGGLFGLKILQYMVLKQDLMEKRIKPLIDSTMKKTQGRYLGVHVRGTEMSFNVEKFYSDYKDIINKYDYIYLATDSQIAKDFFIEKYGSDKIISYVRLFGKNEPLQYVLTEKERASNDLVTATRNILRPRIKNRDMYEVFIDAIIDLIMLGFSEKLIVNIKESGYAQIAMHLYDRKDILNHLVYGKPLENFISTAITSVTGVLKKWGNVRYIYEYNNILKTSRDELKGNENLWPLVKIHNPLNHIINGDIVNYIFDEKYKIKKQLIITSPITSISLKNEFVTDTNIINMFRLSPNVKIPRINPIFITLTVNHNLVYNFEDLLFGHEIQKIQYKDEKICNMSITMIDILSCFIIYLNGIIIDDSYFNEILELV